MQTLCAQGFHTVFSRSASGMHGATSAERKPASMTCGTIPAQQTTSDLLAAQCSSSLFCTCHQNPRVQPPRPTPRTPPPDSAAWGQSLADDPLEPRELRGLMYSDGLDSLGRPVVVVDADAIKATTSRKDACSYMLKRLEPIVQQASPPDPQKSSVLGSNDAQPTLWPEQLQYALETG